MLIVTIQHREKNKIANASVYKKSYVVPNDSGGEI